MFSLQGATIFDSHQCAHSCITLLHYIFIYIFWSFKRVFDYVLGTRIESAVNQIKFNETCGLLWWNLGGLISFVNHTALSACVFDSFSAIDSWSQLVFGIDRRSRPNAEGTTVPLGPNGSPERLPRQTAWSSAINWINWIRWERAFGLGPRSETHASSEFLSRIVVGRDPDQRPWSDQHLAFSLPFCVHARLQFVRFRAQLVRVGEASFEDLFAVPWTSSSLPLQARSHTNFLNKIPTAGGCSKGFCRKTF